MSVQKPKIRPMAPGDAKAMEHVLVTLERLESKIDSLTEVVFRLLGPRPSGSPALDSYASPGHLHVRIRTQPDGDEALGLAYRSVRHQVGMSLEDVISDLSPEVKFSRSSLSNFEKGKGRLDDAQLRDLLRVLNVSADLIDSFAAGRLGESLDLGDDEPALGHGVASSRGRKATPA